MGINRLTLASLLIFSSLVQSCISKECRDAPDLDLGLSINYFPQKDTFDIGDTLYISSIFSNILIDSGKNEMVELNDFSFFTRVSFRVIREGVKVPVEFNNEQLTGIDVNYMLSSYSDNGVGVLIDKHDFSNDTYSFNFGLILNEPGIYYFNSNSNIGETVNTSQQSYEGQCVNQEIMADYIANNGDAYENNFNLIEGKPPYEEVQYFNFNRSGGYAFVVKE